MTPDTVQPFPPPTILCSTVFDMKLTVDTSDVHLQPASLRVDPGTILITGATGYVGGRLLHRLEQDPQHRLRCLTRRPEALAGRTLVEVAHRGRFLAFTFDDGTRVVINPMLSGLFDLLPPETKIRSLIWLPS